MPSSAGQRPVSDAAQKFSVCRKIADHFPLQPFSVLSGRIALDLADVKKQQRQNVCRGIRIFLLFQNVEKPDPVGQMLIVETLGDG